MRQVIEHPNKSTHAQRRRKESQDAVRRRLRATQFIRRLKLIAKAAESADSGAVPALRLQADIYGRLLNKCLPDLKAVEHSGEVIRRDVSTEPMTEDEWETRYCLPQQTGRA
jgi:hypothetical protein